MSEWKEFKLGQLIDSISETYKFKGDPVIFLNTSDILAGKVLNHIWADPKTLPGQAKKRIQKGDLLYSEIRPANKRYARIDFNAEKYVVSTKLMVLRSKGEIDNIFLELFLTSNEILEYLQLIAEDRSGTFPQITFDIISGININLPNLKEQKAIASILSSIDEKIDLLHRQNATIEKMAETLFRKWFVEDAKPEWGEIELKEIVATANTGLDAIRRAPIVENETGIKCLRIQDISQNKPFNKWGNTQVQEGDYKKAQLRKGDIIMARTCSPGIVYFVREDLKAVFNNGLARIRPNENRTFSVFLYYLFKTTEFIGHIYGISGGTSVQLNMKLGDLLSYRLQFPPKDIQNIYLPTFESIDNKIYKNQSQIKTLGSLRDILLPKLMSGEVSVEMNI